jgi:hypothetical protein
MTLTGSVPMPTGGDVVRPTSRARGTLAPTALASLAATSDCPSFVEGLCNLDPATLEFARRSGVSLGVHGVDCNPFGTT